MEHDSRGSRTAASDWLLSMTDEAQSRTVDRKTTRTRPLRDEQHDKREREVTEQCANVWTCDLFMRLRCRKVYKFRGNWRIGHVAESPNIVRYTGLYSPLRNLYSLSNLQSAVIRKC